MKKEKRGLRDLDEISKEVNCSYYFTTIPILSEEIGNYSIYRFSVLEGKDGHSVYPCSSHAGSYIINDYRSRKIKNVIPFSVILGELY